jgi:hypothetical protein
MPIPKELSLTPEQLDELMLTTWNMRIATQGPGGRIWAGGRIYTYCRGRMVDNLRKRPQATILVDRNERFPELQGAMFQGKATVLEDAAAEDADPNMDEMREQMGRKYAGGHGEASAEPRRNTASARGRNWRWVAFTPERIVTWDNFKLPRR